MAYLDEVKRRRTFAIISHPHIKSNFHLRHLESLATLIILNTISYVMSGVVILTPYVSHCQAESHEIGTNLATKFV